MTRLGQSRSGAVGGRVQTLTLSSSASLACAVMAGGERRDKNMKIRLSLFKVCDYGPGLLEISPWDEIKLLLVCFHCVLLNMPSFSENLIIMTFIAPLANGQPSLPDKDSSVYATKEISELYIWLKDRYDICLLAFFFSVLPPLL